MAPSYVPTNSVEFETLTTEPAWGDPKEFDTNAFVGYDGVNRVVPEHWRVLGFLNRDARLGNISNMYDDFEWLEDRIGLTAAVHHLREGAFGDLSPIALVPVAATIELSQSRNGFFRKNAKTAHLTSEQTENVNTGGWLSRLMGKKPKNGGG